MFRGIPGDPPPERPQFRQGDTFNKVMSALADLATATEELQINGQPSVTMTFNTAYDRMAFYHSLRQGMPLSLAVEATHDLPAFQFRLFAIVLKLEVAA